MTELEERLRNSLREAAGTVPRNPHARADFERRLAERRTARFRTSLLATAAAAVVMVGIAIPVVMNSDDDPAQQHAIRTPTSTRPTTPTSGGAAPTSGPAVPKEGYLFAGPVVLGSFVEAGVERAAVMTVEQEGDGERVCVMVRPSTGSHAPGAGCELVPTWPTGPGGTGYVATRAVLGGKTLESGPLPDLMVFMAAPVVTTLDVDSGVSSPVPVNLVAVSPGARFYLADFNGSTQGFGYTAKDATGKVIESAIT